VKNRISSNEIFTSSDQLIEYTVLNLPFSYYMKHLSGSAAVPDPDSSISELLDFYGDMVDLTYFSRRNAVINQGVHYQTATELGFYNYTRKHLDNLLTIKADLDCSIFSPGGKRPVFDAEPMRRVMANLRKNNSRFIFIYGGNDIWTPCAVETEGLENSVSIIEPGADHDVKIRDLSPGNKTLVKEALEKWLDLEIQL
jgi:hypothetical protein